MLFRFRALRLTLFFSLFASLVLPASAPAQKRAGAPKANTIAPIARAGARKPPVPVAATSPIVVDKSAWLYKGSDITPDPAWRFGRLPNGLRYAVRRNGVPPGQVSVRVRIDAGSLMESETERGFAHLIEHLSFRGSAYVPDGEAKRVWQRMGTTFGSDTNAQTTPTDTTYKLDLPNASTAGLDESLKILAGMMAKPNITAQALTAERPVVLAEQREQPGPQVRFGDAVRATFFAGQPLADRSPIGNIKTLEAATAPAVAAFHDRWYRPERAVVIVVGDLDPDVFEELVAKNFADWQGTGPAPAEPDFGKPDPSQPATRAIVEPGLPPAVSMAVLRPWIFHDDTVEFNQKRLVDTLALRLISRRLESRARAGGSFVQASAVLDDISRSVNGTFIDIVPIGDDWEAALRDVRAVIADAQANPPSMAELTRELAEFDVAMKTPVDTAAAEAGSKQADDMVQALDIRETVTAPATAYEILQDARRKNMFTPDAILASTRRVMTGDATHALVSTQTPDPAAADKLAAALTADVSAVAAQRSFQGDIAFSKLPRLGHARRIVSREVINKLGMEKVVFSNGVRLIVFPNPSESNRVYVRVRFGGGYGALPPDRSTPAWSGNQALVASGIGKFGLEALDALTVGRRIGMDFGIGDDAFTLDASTSPGDLKDQLYIMAAKLDRPGWDPAPVARTKAITLAGYASYDSSPDGVLSRDLDGLLHDGDPRWVTPTRQQVMALTADQFRLFWAPILKSGPIEILVFGDVTANGAIDLVRQSFGRMRKRSSGVPPPSPVRFPAHRAQPLILTHNGPENQAVAVLAWPTAGGIERIRDSRRLDVLAAVFSDRLFDRLRSDAGASYSPTVQSNWPVGLPGGGQMLAVGRVPPEKVDFFFKLVREIAADLAANPISADELSRSMGPLIQYVVRSSTGNTFWLNQLAGATVDPRRIKAVDGIGRDLSGITPDQLQQVAARYLSPDRDWSMAVVPKGDGAAATK